MRVLWLCAVLIGGLALTAAQPNLADDPRLQKPIAAWLKMEPLADALRTLSRATGVRLSCSSTIQAQKVAIFLPAERPAHEVLTQLARALRYEWRVREEENGYMLVAPDELRRQEQEVSYALREARRQAVRDLIDATRELARKTPEELEAVQQALSKAPNAQQDPKVLHRWYILAYLQQSRLQVSEPRPDGNIKTVPYVLPEATILGCLAKMSPAAQNALLNGQWVGLSTRPARGIYPYPSDVLLPNMLRELVMVEHYDESGQLKYYSETKQENPALVGVWMRLSPHRNNAILYQLVSFTQPITSGSPNELIDSRLPRLPQLNIHTGVLPFHLMPYAQEHSFLRSWREWSTPVSEWAKHLPKEPQPINRPEPPLPEYIQRVLASGSVLLTAADVLERVAWLTGKPVVADAFRSETTFVSRNLLSNPLQLLRQLERSCWLRFDESGYLLARTQLYWARQRLELPEEKLRALERKFKAGEWLDLRDYVDLAASLTPEQVERFAAPDGSQILPAAEFPLHLLTEVRGLRFLASLSKTQYQQALSGEWIPFDALSPVQRQRFYEALNDEFPPIETLFASIPEQYVEGIRLTLPRATASNRGLGTLVVPALPEILADTPDRPAFRLQAEQEQLTEIIGVSSDGAIVSYSMSSLFITQSDSSSESYLRAKQKEILESYPNAQLFQRRQIRCILSLSAPPRRKAYDFTQSRLEPVKSAEQAE